MTERVHRVACVLAVAAAGSLYIVAELPAGARGEGYITVHLVLTAVMVLAWRARPPNHSWALWTGIAARVLLIGVPAFTTHDIERYLYDGAVVMAGFDPYGVTPLDLDLAAIAERWPVASEHAAFPTIYPPGALVVFALCSLAGPVWAATLYKVVVALASVAMLRPVYGLLRRRGRARHFALVALNPLLILEGGVGGHVDILAALAVALALDGWDRGRGELAGAAIALALLTKLTGGILLLPLSAVAGPRARLWLGFIVTAGAAYGVALLAGWVPIGSLPVFVAQWRFGSPAGWLGAAAPVAAAVAAAVIAVGAGWRLGWERGCFVALGIVWFVSPVVFPWYLAPLVPVIALRPSYLGLAWISVLPLTYEVIDRFDVDGTWEPASWPLVLIAASWILGALADRRWGAAIDGA